MARSTSNPQSSLHIWFVIVLGRYTIRNLSLLPKFSPPCSCSVTGSYLSSHMLFNVVSTSKIGQSKESVCQNHLFNIVNHVCVCVRMFIYTWCVWMHGVCVYLCASGVCVFVCFVCVCMCVGGVCWEGDRKISWVLKDRQFWEKHYQRSHGPKLKREHTTNPTIFWHLFAFCFSSLWQKAVSPSSTWARLYL